MGDCDSTISEVGEENLIAAARHIVKALGSNKKLTFSARKTLAELGTQLSTMAALNETKGDGVSEIKDRLYAVEEKILSWEEDQSMIWDSGPEEASEYLNAADEARKLTERLESLCLNKDDDEYKLLHRAHNVLQKAMERLEEEFSHMLVENREPFEPECFQAYTSARKDALDECLFILEMEKLSIEDVSKMEWVSLNSKIKRWVRTMKIIVQFYLASLSCQPNIYRQNNPICNFSACASQQSATHAIPSQPDTLALVLSCSYSDLHVVYHRLVYTYKTKLH